jgi:hypothetical protein
MKIDRLYDQDTCPGHQARPCAISPLAGRVGF